METTNTPPCCGSPIGGGGIDFGTALFWAFYGSIFDGSNILSTSRLSSILGLFYGFILGDRIKSPLTD
jgi:hypothetical protein